jgi:hypothetical protein
MARVPVRAVVVVAVLTVLVVRVGLLQTRLALMTGRLTPAGILVGTSLVQYTRVQQVAERVVVILRQALQVVVVVVVEV